jgi:putative nucleotidyltransferase with HDIG domain
MTVATAQPTFIEQIENLPPVAAIMKHIVAATSSSTASVDDVARVLSSDPGIAAKILRIANSPFYGSGRRITQISRAVVMLGSVAIRNLVTAICACDALSASAGRTREYNILWQHSIAAGAACDLIARRVGYRPPEEASLGGLLHDIGQLAMVAFQPAAFRAVFRDQGKGMRFLALERLHVGIDHVEAGDRILTQWGLPEILCRVVRNHHLPDISPQESHGRLLAIVILGDIFAHRAGMGLDIPAGTSRRAQMASAFIGLTDSDQVDVLDRLGPRVEEALSILVGEDAAVSSKGGAANTRAIWVSPDTTSRRFDIGRLLLERCGYRAQRVSETVLASTVQPSDLIILDFPDADPHEADRLGVLLTTQGMRKVVKLIDHSDDTLSRNFDSKTGLCCLPRLFSVLDIKWAEGLWPH